MFRPNLCVVTRKFVLLHFDLSNPSDIDRFLTNATMVLVNTIFSAQSDRYKTLIEFCLSRVITLPGLAHRGLLRRPGTGKLADF